MPIFQIESRFFKNKKIKEKWGNWRNGEKKKILDTDKHRKGRIEILIICVYPCKSVS
jgi:hypothetical protein